MSAISRLCVVSSLILLPCSLAAAAEIAPTTGQVDKDGNEILEGEEGKPVPSKAKKKPKARESRFAEKPREVSLPEPGEDPEDDGGADDVPLPTHPLLRRAVLNRKRAEAQRAGESSEEEGEAEASETEAAKPVAEAKPASKRGLFFGLGALLLIFGTGGWLLSQSRSGFGPQGAKKVK